MSAKSPLTPSELAEHLARIEQRMARIEQQLGLAIPAANSPVPEGLTKSNPVEPPEEDFELVVGQTWFAQVGVFVLVCGVGLTMCLPFASLPPVLPALVGILLAAGLYLGGHFARSALARMAAHCRGAGMALFHLATLRLFFFGQTPALDIDSLPGRLLLVLVVGLNLFLALRERSAILLTLALLAGFLTAVLVGSPWFVMGLIAGLILFIRRVAPLIPWPGLLLVASGGAFATHLYWAAGRPWSGRPLHFVTAPGLSLFAILFYIVLLALGPLTRKDRSLEDPATVLIAFLNCGLGYGLLLLHTLVAFAPLLAPVHVTAALVFLGLAAVHWHCEHSRVSTFFYAMTGYLALSVVILKVFPVPAVFLWLSLQSLVVVATALWFRSRFIVVANFIIYLLIATGYLIVARDEPWISLGFGVVALVTARILNWQRPRLELQTEMMCNAYLGSAFVIFPYALFQLMPRVYVSLGWVGIALVYYFLNLIVQNPKYRWMGHLTLLLTVGYVLLVGVTQLAPVYRILSFLVLGVVLLVVSLLFTRSRSREQKNVPAKEPEGLIPDQPSKS